jgi:hypothetical protein
MNRIMLAVLAMVVSFGTGSAFAAGEIELQKPEVHKPELHKPEVQRAEVQRPEIHKPERPERHR